GFPCLSVTTAFTTTTSTGTLNVNVPDFSSFFDSFSPEPFLLSAPILSDVSTNNNESHRHEFVCLRDIRTLRRSCWEPWSITDRSFDYGSCITETQSMLP